MNRDEALVAARAARAAKRRLAKEGTERLVMQAEGLPASKPEAHIRMVRNDPGRIAQMKRRGFRPATPDDVLEVGRGYVEGAEIHDGDLIAMVGSREEVEKRERDRIQLQEDADKKVSQKFDRDERGDGLDFTSDPERNYQERGGTRFYSIPK
jgi:hypothetical protein